jgi:hypothetical protein
LPDRPCERSEAKVRETARGGTDVKDDAKYGGGRICLFRRADRKVAAGTSVAGHPAAPNA